jgi:hypothetical protein
MNKKAALSLSRIILISFVILFSIAAMSFAATTVTWDNEAGDHNWNTPLNWSTNVVPPATSSYYAKIAISAGPIISTSQTAAAYRVYLDGSNGSMTIDGGTLNLVSSWIGIGYTTSSDSGTLTMNSGTINTTGISGHIYCGVDGTGVLNMSGGTINLSAKLYVGRDPTGLGTVNLSGGTITCIELLIGSGGGTGTIDITGAGTLIIDNAGTTNLAAYIANGWVLAYGGAGTLDVDTTSSPGYTIVTALSQTKAANPSPADEDINVSTSADLSWKALAGATSHDVYFGTNQSDVTNTNRLAGDLDGDGIVDFKDILRLTDYWLLDPTGSDPYAGVNGDTTVDFVDYTLLAQDWKTSANPVFKGNQDTNTFDPGTMAEGTIYYWRVDEVNSSGTETGYVWQFSTEGFANIRKGPYLIYPGVNTQMTVLWQVDATTTSSNIAWGTDTSYSLGSVNTTEYGSDHQHKYTITGLTPGAKYYYRVTICGVPYTGSFTAAPAASATDLKFFMYGDTRTNGISHNSILSQVVSTYTADPAYQTIALHSGDWVSSDSESIWTTEWYNYTWTNIVNVGASMPIMGCIGNHEGNGSCPVFDKYRPFPFAAAPAEYYSFDYGPVHIAVVDQYVSYAPGSAQHTWLVADLSGTTKPWKIIVLHQPGWSCDDGHDNDTNVQNYIQPLCTTYDVSIVVAGHNHYYSRAVVSGVHHLTDGGGGAPLYTPVSGMPNIVTCTRTLAVSKVVISGSTLTCTTVNQSGTVIDTFVVTK